MKNKMYLIHEDDYIKHINEKVFLYSLVKQLTFHISRLTPNRGSKALTNTAKRYGEMTEKLFQSWGIPMSYLVFENPDDLAVLMENELIEPEDAGYFACSGDCRCDNENNDTTEVGADEDFNEMLLELSSLIQAIFGGDVPVHIIVE